MNDRVQLRMNLLGDEIGVFEACSPVPKTISGVKEKLFLGRLAAAFLVEGWPEAVPRDQLRGALWPKSNLACDVATRDRDLGKKRCDINRALGCEILQSLERGKAYRLRLEVVRVDVVELKRAVEAPSPRAAVLEAPVLACWEAGGRLLRGYQRYQPGDVGWIIRAEAEVEKLYVQGLAHLVRLYRSAGRFAEAMERRSWLEEHGAVSAASAALRSSLLETLPSAEQLEQEKARAERPANLGGEIGETRTHVVCGGGSGTHATIGAAIEDAQAGDTILVEPGLYRESLLVAKPLRIVGRGDRSDTVVESHGASAVTVRTPAAFLGNLGLRQKGRGEWCAVDVRAGTLTLSECEATAEGVACVRIGAGAAGNLARNRIHGSPRRGVLVLEGAGSVLEDNDIFHNAGAGVEITGGADPALIGNRIHDNRGGDGVLVHAGGHGTLEGNTIFGNTFAGVSISLRGEPILRDNTIYHNRGDGVFAQQEGRGRLENNVIYGNTTAGVSVKTQGRLVLRGNTIKDGKMDGVYVHEGGYAELENNAIAGNALSGVAVAQKGEARLSANRITGNRGAGVRFTEEGRGTVEGNDLRGNRGGACEIADDSQPDVRRAGNHE